VRRSKVPYAEVLALALMEVSMRPIEQVRAELLDFAGTGILAGIRAALPKGCIPVPEFKPRENAPPSWRKAFKKYGGRGNLEYWPGILEEHCGGAVLLVARNHTDMPRSEVRKILCEFGEEAGRRVRTLKHIDGKPCPKAKDIFTWVEGSVLGAFPIILTWMVLNTPTEDTFSPLLYRSFVAGGVPCGWLGKFPKGRLIVYWPYDQEPQFE
jgi:hypothetical protein